MTVPVIAAEVKVRATTLIGILARQLDLYHQLGQHSLEQAQIIEAGTADDLLGVLASRSRLIDALIGLKRDLEPYAQQWARLLVTLTPSQRQQIENLTRQIEALREAIIRQDDRDCQSLEAARGQIRGDLDKLTHAGRALDAYKVRPAGDCSCYTNRQG